MHLFSGIKKCWTRKNRLARIVLAVWEKPLINSEVIAEPGCASKTTFGFERKGKMHFFLFAFRKSRNELFEASKI